MKKTLLIISLLLSPFILMLVSIAVIIGITLLILMSEEKPNYENITLSEFGENEIPSEFIPIYQEAGEKYAVNWLILAAIHRVETNFSTNVNTSSAGAIGHTQFLVCTWLSWNYPSCSTASRAIYTNPEIISKYGGYGVDANGDGIADPYNIEDAIHSTANLISHNLSMINDIRQAIFAYNHAEWYVNEVLGFAEAFSGGYIPVDGRIIEIDGETAWMVPHTKNITSEYGERWGTQHKGIDIAGGGDLGKPILAFMAGEVIYSQWNTGGYGYLVIIEHENNLKTYYAHLQKQGIKKGTKVKAGQVIGYMGSTGNSTGPHLHFEIRKADTPVNPRPYLAHWIGTEPIK
ncbi:peptidoglycan DD-metalloendopeptidase family protein [Cytobacillus horneckiae]|uniref:M23ase beta-sheet core domain-containing protein n=1 Tax=Cytobacillus horneckiae TaxID=549687 RepID=A0A2N0ZB10_9BACI|nr:peptidoglycan DD-metalloendopeptidase family protein [Cytobacillus horneckiae]MEC1158695.1 peptidoglycan DD-metalloendopeptidase family protein [Cytobacillus horneckiae]NRG46653.1 peptidoglycan DD-metalloendopeptidase family protein [Bacillus sp. CRN 9]PKG26693.1 hypothetical protein CWS20_22870 [Cytobacillus horneckiae]